MGGERHYEVYIDTLYRIRCEKVKTVGLIYSMICKKKYGK